MLGRQNRLPGRAIDRAKDRGQYWRGNGLAIKSLVGKQVPRIAIVVPKKVDNRATKRNYVRRLISESLQALLPSLPPQDSVIFVNRLLTHQEVVQELSKWSKKASSF